ncbi:MAG: RNA recognition motif domain-containing protein [Gammaproteobacteria bacterium]
MGIILSVGNLSAGVSDEDLLLHFSDYGAVESVTVDRDALTSLQGSWAQVVMKNNEEAQAAIDWLHDTQFDGRTISVTRGDS